MIEIVVITVGALEGMYWLDMPVWMRVVAIAVPVVTIAAIHRRYRTAQRAVA